ncbi:hypothetical protein DCC39_16225 [Pueribacillus theae]|uniref:ATP-grasp domain-containing protein n=1 Tax=Pueribacillus theae TaxID=2171751 RepID=A0A2U1JSL1_9BACI|nr:acetate--CoA ligase family protein [Pueribacillus theae]PWA07798.1 hypothetical protein DCC39_16225 [Pueribacillus theae]
MGSSDKRFLTEYEGSKLLQQYSLPVAQSNLATSKEEALTLAETIGYPVVLKGMSEKIIHKSDAGIVRVNVENGTQLSQVYDEILENAHEYDPSADVDGILVQKMVEKGLEMIVGVKKDPVFSHQLIIGLGGVFVEVLRDFSIKMMPVSEEEIYEMIGSLKGASLMKGYRGEEGINIDNLLNIVKGLNKLIDDHPEIEEMDLNPIIFHGDKATICDVRIGQGSKDEKPKYNNVRTMDELSSMLNPKSIAVIGASTNEKKNGGRLFRYIVENEFPGELYPVHPTADEIKGYKAYSNIMEIPSEIDLACIIVGAKYVLSVLKDCVKKNVKTAIIYSSGFAEVGDEGKELQRQVTKIARDGGIKLLGPNSIGIASPSKKIFTAFGAALEAKKRTLGHIGFISQSGAMGSALLSRAWEEGAGFSRWISVANEADLTTSDFIHALSEDEETKVISAFMESIQDAEAFKTASEKALSQKKPVIIYKTGRSDVGKRAVQSHTGSIAGDDNVYSSVFDKLCILRARKIEELIDVSRAFEIQPLPKGNRIGVLTASGGACSVIADLCESHGLSVPSLNDATVIEQLIPPFGSATNPVDVTAEVIAKPEMFKSVIETLIKDRNIDGVIIMLTTNADPGAFIIAKSILEVFKTHQKPIVLGRLGAQMIAPKAMEFYHSEKFPVYPTPERVVNVMSQLVKYQSLLQKHSEKAGVL